MVKLKQNNGYEDEPKREELTDPVVIPSAVLERLNGIDEQLSRFKERLGLVSTNNGVVTMVLFALVAAVVLGAIYQFIGAINSENAIRQQLIQSVNDLRVELESLKNQKQPTAPIQNQPNEMPVN